MVWISSSGDLAVVDSQSSYDVLLQPGDWSGTVTEQSCTLVRLILMCYTMTVEAAGAAHAQNFCITLGDASEGGGYDTLDISAVSEWPDFFERHDRVLHIGRLEWEGAVSGNANVMPVQYSQLPDPVVNLKCPRLLRGDDSIRLWIGGQYVHVGTEVVLVRWFCRSLVRVGLR